MENYDDIINSLYKRLCSYRPQPLELREYLREHMTSQRIGSRKMLYKKRRPVKEALYVAEGFVACYGNNELGTGQLLSLYPKGQIVAGFSFMSQEPAIHDLVALPGSYILGISYEHMKIIYQRFPSTEELARIIIAARSQEDMERLQQLKSDADTVVLEFYSAYPCFLSGRLLPDADIAAYLLIGESTLRNTRAKLLKLHLIENNMPDN